MKFYLLYTTPDISIITADDVKKWEEIVRNEGLGSNYKSSRLYKVFKRAGLIRDVVSQQQSWIPTGSGLKPDNIIYIPTDPEELKNEFILLLAATKAGHNNTFNTTNVLMKEMLKQKLINSKKYISILREYFYL